MKLALKTAATEEPVSLEEAKTHARIDSNGDDADIQSKVLAARSHVEDLTARALVSSAWRLWLNAWPGTLPATVGLPWYSASADEIPLPLGNLSAVTSVTYKCADGTVKTLDPTVYEVDAPGNRIVLAAGKSWPGDALSKASPICIEFVAGWPNADSVPQPIKSAILLLMAHWYRNREAVTIGRSTVESMPLKMAVDALLAPYILWRL